MRSAASTAAAGLSTRRANGGTQLREPRCDCARRPSVLGACWQKNWDRRERRSWAENTQFYTHSNGSLLLVGTAHGTAHGTTRRSGPLSPASELVRPKLPKVAPRSFLEVRGADGEPWAERRAAANAIWLVDAGASGATREVSGRATARSPAAARPRGEGAAAREAHLLRRAKKIPRTTTPATASVVARSAHDLVRWEVPGGIRS